MRTLEQVQRLYALAEPRRFAEHALLILLDTADATAGYTVFRTPGGGAVGGALRGRRPKRMQAQMRTLDVAAAVAARLAEPAFLCAEHPGAMGHLAQPLKAPHLVSIRLHHTEAECDSLWILGRSQPFPDDIIDRLVCMEKPVTYAGDLMLPRLPGGPGGFYTRVRIGPMADEGERTPNPSLELLDGLSAVSADCARLAARGYTNRQIACYLHIKDSAVGRHLSNVYRHLGIEGRHQLDVERLLMLPKPTPRLHGPRRGRPSDRS